MSYVVRVSSYNLRDFKDDTDAAARVVRAICPDILCLQEVPRQWLSGRRIARFAAACGLSWSGGHRGSGGTTVMSSQRVDVADLQHHRLPVPFLHRERGYAVSRIRLQGHQSVGFVSMHLSLDAGERVRHAAMVLSELLPDGAMVLAGDMNEGPDGQAWRSIAGRLRAVSGDEPTFPARSPRHRLDVIFASATLPPVTGGQVRLDPTDLVTATDHLPVWVDLDLSSVALR